MKKLYFILLGAELLAGNAAVMASGYDSNPPELGEKVECYAEYAINGDRTIISCNGCTEIDNIGVARESSTCQP